ncbi:hypothetical protein [Mucilaginibacter xinganensis]|uniref:Uncharacterized protein n=1 Tax=Mucilaginibacter xinganensis TaxID=1234841 RepID=A0A223P3J7_9SPHI|nr:hypothetical protein [Mucilaginibacter xinganensis]ASU36391.1 hypothetical protein MuYL_4506 [Mucilaginibacter xinganensis]
MKRTTLSILLLTGLLITVSVQAQDKSSAFRKQRPEETAFLNKLHNALFYALPHTFRDWTTGKEDTTFDAMKYWCRDPVSWHDCTGDILKTVGLGDPYALDWQVEFTMPEAESGGLMGAAVSGIKDYTNAQQVAAALKSINRTKLKIFIVANLYITGTHSSMALSYCAKTPPVALSIPVPTTLALKGIRSAGCPIMDGGSVSLHGDYYDTALVFLGKPVVAKSTENTNDGLTDTRYELAFNRTKIGRLVVQNIAVQFKGDSADIDEAIKMIDWQKLSDLIER